MSWASTDLPRCLGAFDYLLPGPGSCAWTRLLAALCSTPRRPPFAAVAPGWPLLGTPAQLREVGLTRVCLAASGSKSRLSRLPDEWLHRACHGVPRLRILGTVVWHQSGVWGGSALGQVPDGESLCGLRPETRCCSSGGIEQKGGRDGSSSPQAIHVQPQVPTRPLSCHNWYRTLAQNSA